MYVMKMWVCSEYTSSNGLGLEFSAAIASRHSSQITESTTAMRNDFLLVSMTCSVADLILPVSKE